MAKVSFPLAVGRVTSHSRSLERCQLCIHIEISTDLAAAIALTEDAALLTSAFNKWNLRE
jgi:hypothetical protein